MFQVLNYLAWTDTDDPFAYLSVPAAIDFQTKIIGQQSGSLPSLTPR
jgi:hypothetical protein